VPSILLDHSVPVPLRLYLSGHEVVRTARQEGWDTRGNGDLLDAAEKAGFNVLVTADKGFRTQQNLARRNIAVVLLPTNRLADLRPIGDDIARAVNTAAMKPGQLLAVPMPPGRRRPGPKP
jgi:hypothetical protein